MRLAPIPYFHCNFVRPLSKLIGMYISACELTRARAKRIPGRTICIFVREHHADIPAIKYRPVAVTRLRIAPLSPSPVTFDLRVYTPVIANIRPPRVALCTNASAMRRKRLALPAKRSSCADVRRRHCIVIHWRNAFGERVANDKRCRSAPAVELGLHRLFSQP